MQKFFVIILSIVFFTWKPSQKDTSFINRQLERSNDRNKETIKEEKSAYQVEEPFVFVLLHCSTAN